MNFVPWRSFLLHQRPQIMRSISTSHCALDKAKPRATRNPPRDELMSTFLDVALVPPQKPAPNPYPTAPAQSTPASWDMWSDVLTVTSKYPEQTLKKPTPEERWKAKSEASARHRARAVIESGPGIYAGRSFPVALHNVVGAYSRVMSTLSRNKVRQELRRTERHEKPTDMRRRLASERHRRRFAQMISEKVKLVEEIRARGG